MRAGRCRLVQRKRVIPLTLGCARVLKRLRHGIVHGNLISGSGSADSGPSAVLLVTCRMQIQFPSKKTKN